MIKYDGLIKSHPKDYSKLPFIIKSAELLDPKPEKIYLITPDGHIPKSNEFVNIDEWVDKIVPYKDEEVFPNLNKNNIHFRKNWIYAMFNALFQDITENDHYLDLQADNIYLENFSVFNAKNKPKLFFDPKRQQVGSSYYKWMDEILGFKPISKKNYIIEFMMFNKQIINDILKWYYNEGQLLEEEKIDEVTPDNRDMLVKYIFDNAFTTNKIDRRLYPSEYLLYAHWCEKNYPDAIFVEKFCRDVRGKKYDWRDKKIGFQEYSSQEIFDILGKYKNIHKHSPAQQKEYRERVEDYISMKPDSDLFEFEKNFIHHETREFLLERPHHYEGPNVFKAVALHTWDQNYNDDWEWDINDKGEMKKVHPKKLK